MKNVNIREVVNLLRPHQYIKNIFVFAPLLFSFKFNISNLNETLYAFI
jgi:decaprenyl-phosphate phosphoribosyltransferase